MVASRHSPAAILSGVLSGVPVLTTILAAVAICGCRSNPSQTSQVPATVPDNPSRPASESKKEIAPTEVRDCWGDILPPGALARLGTIRYRINAYRPIGRLQFNADSSIIRAGLSAWDVRTGELQPPLLLPEEDAHIRFLGFSSDGKQALYCSPQTGSTGVPHGSSGRVLTLRDTRTGDVVKKFEGDAGRGWAGGATFSTDGRYAAVIDLDMRVGGDSWGSAFGFAVWDVNSGQKIITKDNPVSAHYAMIGGLDFSPDCKFLALAGSDGVIRIYDLPGGNETRTCSTKAQQIWAPRFIDQQTLCVGGSDGVFIWKLDQSAPEFWKANTQIVYQNTVSPDRKYLASATWKGLAVFELATGKPLVSPDESQQADVVISVAFSDDGRLLAFSRGQCVEFLEVGTWKPAHTVQSHTVPVQALAVSADGRLIATGDSHGVIRLWDDHGRPLKTFQHDNCVVEQLAISPDGKTVASPMGLWNIADGKLQVAYESDTRCLLRFVDQGRQVLEVGQNAICWRDVSSGTPVRTIKLNHPYAIVRATMSTDGSILVWSETDQSQQWKSRPSSQPTNPVYTAHIYDIIAGKEIAHYSVGEHALALSPDGKRLAVGESIDYQQRPARLYVTIRDTATGKVRNRIVVEPGYSSLLEWSPDGRFLAAEYRDNIIRIYETDGFREIGRFTGHPNYIQKICWFAEGKKLVSVGYDTTGLIWDMSKMQKSTATQAIEMVGEGEK